MIVGWINSCKDIANISTINREFYAICCKVAALKDDEAIRYAAICGHKDSEMEVHPKPNPNQTYKFRSLLLISEFAFNFFR